MLPMAAKAHDEVLVLTRAERIGPDGRVETVALADRQTLAPGATGPIERVYRWRVDLAAPLDDGALYLPGLRAYGRIAVNGQTVFDSRPALGPSLPRSLNVPVLVRAPPGLWRAGANQVELYAIGARSVGVSSLEVGPAVQLAEHFHLRVLGTVVGPALVAAVIATIGSSILVLWWRRREAIYGYFGFGVLGWALHTLWSLLPFPLLPPPHQAVWWHVLYSAFVAMLVLFSLRFAEAHWPRFERLVWAMLGASPVVLYAALWLAPGRDATAAWRLLLIALVAVGVAAIARAARVMPNLDRALITVVGAVALVAAGNDWWQSMHGRDNNPVYAVPYVGLLFAAFVMRVLIDRFLAATRRAEAMNVQLEMEVAQRSAELRVALEEMRRARDAAQAADRAKTRFLAATSHDLRQPAHALGLYVASLRRHALAPPQAELVDRIGTSLDALDAMFDTLLDVSRIDAGAVTPRVGPVDLTALAQRVADDFGPEAEARGLRLVLRVAPACAVVRGDAVLIERIVRNLLANAVKYTTHGGVLLSVRVRRRDDGRPEVRIEVWDTGPGIAEEAREQVFEEYYQAANPGRDRRLGLGLGLAIVRRLATLMGLTVRLHSRVGRGSVFVLEGLRPWVGALPAAPLAGPADCPDLCGLSVAVIEDDVDVREAMGRLLHSWGCRVLAAPDAPTLLAQRPQAPNAVVADVRLAGGRDGPQEVRTLQAHWGTTVPTLFVTGETAPERVQALDRDGLAWLAKPVVPQRLHDWLAQAAVRPREAEPAAIKEVSAR
jgi:signal transduction histidine kinase